MTNFKQIFNEAYNNAYVFAYDSTLKHNFSDPKIYTAKGDLTKRWYVYFSFRNPKTGKLKRVTPFYGCVNSYKTKAERMEVLVVYRRVLLKLLKQGYNPFEDNTALYEKFHSDNISEKSTTATTTVSKDVVEALDDAMPYKQALYLGLKFKEKLVNETTKRSYKNRIDIFVRWVEKYKPEVNTIEDLNKKVISSFLNHVLENHSARNRNNYRADLSSVLQVLEDNDILKQNAVKKIPILKSIPQRNKTYTQETQEAIFKHLEKEDPILLLFIKFISFNFLRPIEVCRLNIGSIDLTNRTVQFKAKNSPLKTKIIPELLYNELPDLSMLNKEHSLFTPEKIGGEWDIATDNKRDYFTKRFRRVVKDKFNLGKDYGLYSFRHTYITKLYRAMVANSSPFEAKSKLMLITGHSSMTALEKYLRDIDAELPQDYSEMLKNIND